MHFILRCDIASNFLFLILFGLPRRQLLFDRATKEPNYFFQLRERSEIIREGGLHIIGGGLHIIGGES